ncbi:MAG: hypothetical protein IJ176_02395 [Prevotella sp.]|nr:hypothetical protein [Prevotella sp.]
MAEIKSILAKIDLVPAKIWFRRYSVLPFAFGGYAVMSGRKVFWCSLASVCMFVLLQDTVSYSLLYS